MKGVGVPPDDDGLALLDRDRRHSSRSSRTIRVTEDIGVIGEAPWCASYWKEGVKYGPLNTAVQGQTAVIPQVMSEGAFVFVNRSFTDPPGLRLGQGGQIIRMYDDAALIKFKDGELVISQRSFGNLDLVEEGPAWLLAEKQGRALRSLSCTEPQAQIPRSTLGSTVWFRVGGFCNIRESASFGSTLVGGIAMHEAFEVSEQVERAGRVWLKLSDGRGWVFARNYDGEIFCQEIQGGEGGSTSRMWLRVGSSGSIRESPNLTSSLICEVAMHEAFEVTALIEREERLWLQLSDGRGWICARDNDGEVCCRKVQARAVFAQEDTTDIHGNALNRLQIFKLRHAFEDEYFTLHALGQGIDRTRRVPDLGKFEDLVGAVVRFNKSVSCLQAFLRAKLWVVVNIDGNSMELLCPHSGEAAAVNSNDWEKVHICEDMDLSWEASVHFWMVAIRLFGLLLTAVVIEGILLCAPNGVQRGGEKHFLPSLSIYLASSRVANLAIASMAVVQLALALFVACASCCPRCFAFLRFDNVPFGLIGREAQGLRDEGAYLCNLLLFTLTTAGVYALTCFPLCMDATLQVVDDEPWYGEDCSDEYHMLSTMAVFGFPLLGVFMFFYLNREWRGFVGGRGAALLFASIAEVASAVAIGASRKMVGTGRGASWSSAGPPSGAPAFLALGAELLAIWLLVASALGRLMLEGGRGVLANYQGLGGGALAIVLMVWLTTVVARAVCFWEM